MFNKKSCFLAILLLILFATLTSNSVNSANSNRTFIRTSTYQKTELLSSTTTAISNVFHDQGYTYMVPLEPTTTQSVALQIRADTGNLSSAYIQYTLNSGTTWKSVTMSKKGVDETGYYDYWVGTIPAQTVPYYYRFQCKNSRYTVYVNIAGTSSTANTLLGTNYYVEPGFSTPARSKIIVALLIRFKDVNN